MNSQRYWIFISGVLGFLGVAFGAFGAHILKSQLSAEMMEVFETGIQYQLIHSVVMFSIALSGIQKYLKAEILFLTGIVLFSFSLYIYAVTSVKFFAMLTPVGGVFLLTGWILIIVNGLRKD